MQIFPPAAAPEGSAADQRAQSFGAEERADAANGHRAQRPAPPAAAHAANGNYFPV